MDFSQIQMAEKSCRKLIITRVWLNSQGQSGTLGQGLDCSWPKTGSWMITWTNIAEILPNLIFQQSLIKCDGRKCQSVLGRLKFKFKTYYFYLCESSLLMIAKLERLFMDLNQIWLVDMSCKHKSTSIASQIHQY